MPGPRVWPVALAYLVAVGWVLVIPATLLLAWLGLREGPQALARPESAALQALALSFPGLSLTVVVNSGAMAAIALAAARFSPQGLRQRLALGAPRVSWALTALLVLGVLALSQGLDAMAVLAGVSDRGFLSQLRQMVRSLPPGSLVALTLLMGLGPGLGEELLFRGYIQTRLVTRLGPGRGIVVAGLLFGMLHLDPVQAPMAAVLGCYLGYVAWRAGSVWPAVVCHLVNNMVAIVGSWGLPENLGGRWACVAQVVVGLTVAAACLWILTRATRARGATGAYA